MTKITRGVLCIDGAHRALICQYFVGLSGSTGGTALTATIDASSIETVAFSFPEGDKGFSCFTTWDVSVVFKQFFFFFVCAFSCSVNVTKQSVTKGVFVCRCRCNASEADSRLFCGPLRLNRSDRANCYSIRLAH